jgi:hypothetical protein
MIDKMPVADQQRPQPAEPIAAPVVEAVPFWRISWGARRRQLTVGL